MSRLLTLALTTMLASATACIVVVEPTERDEDPIVVDECDADMDGVQSEACGGMDCDDLDASVRPGADEIFGDDVDQDCDGTLDARVDRVDTPARTVPLDWRWGDDLRSLGGVIVTSTGDLAAQELILDPEFGGGVVLKRRTEYGSGEGVVNATRATLGGAILDVVVQDDLLVAWRPNDGEPTSTEIGAFPFGSFDLETMPADGGLWVVGCGADGVAAALVDADLQLVVQHELATNAARCAPLSSADGSLQVVLADASNNSINRWRVTPEAGFYDRLRLATDVVPDRVRTARSAAGSVLAFHDDGSILIVDGDGYGAMVGEGTATSTYDIALADDGSLLVSWTDEQGLAWAGIGGVRDPLDALPLAEGLLADDVAAGLIDGEMAVAVQEGASVLLLRARR